MDLEAIKKNFYYYKDSKGLSWQDLASRAGVKSYTQIINYFNKPGLTLASLEKLANILEVQPWELMKPTPEAGTAKQPNIICCPYCNKLLSISANKIGEPQTPEHNTFFANM